MDIRWFKQVGQYPIIKVSKMDNVPSYEIWVEGYELPVQVPEELLKFVPAAGDRVVVDEMFRVGDHTQLTFEVVQGPTIKEMNDSVLDIYRVQGKKLLSLLRANIPEFDGISGDAKVALLMKLDNHDDAVEFINAVQAKHKVYHYTYPQAIESVMAEYVCG